MAALKPVQNLRIQFRASESQVESWKQLRILALKYAESHNWGQEKKDGIVAVKQADMMEFLMNRGFEYIQNLENEYGTGTGNMPEVELNDFADMKSLEAQLGREARETGISLQSLSKRLLDDYKKSADPEGTGTVKIAGVVRELMRDNTAAVNWWEKTAISASVVFERTGANQTTIRKWLAEYQHIIDEHHATVGIKDPMKHNRDAGRERKNRQ